MKGLSIKRIAALGIGAALIGSALAPVVSAEAFNNLDTLEKTDVVSSAGIPVVDVVVGGSSAISDVVWAGNIAARVAQLATKPATGECGAGEITDATVDYTTGGTMTTVGAGELSEAIFEFSTQEANLSGLEVTDTKVPYLINDSSAKLRWNGVNSTTSVQETLEASINAGYQGETSSSRYAVGEMYGTLNSGDFNYNVTFGDAIDISTSMSGMDSNSDVDVKIPWLGQVYVLDEIVAGTSPKLVLYSQTLPTDLLVGEDISAVGAGVYAGKTLTVKLDGIYEPGPSTSDWSAKWNLYDGDTFVASKTSEGTYDLKDQFGSTVIADSINVTFIGKNIDGTGVASVRTGEDRLELKHNSGYPFADDPTVDNYSQYKVVLNSTTAPTKISLVNQWKYSKTSGTESATSNQKYVLKVGDKVTLPNSYGEVEFKGFQTKVTRDVMLGEGKIDFTDLKGTAISVPLFKSIDLDANVATPVDFGNSKEYTLYYNDSNGALYYRTGLQEVTSEPTGWSSIVVDADVTVDAEGIPFDLGIRNASGATVNVDYNVSVSESNSSAMLMLDAQTFSLYNKAKSGATLQLIGTQVAADENIIDPATLKTYFQPNMSETDDAISAFTYDNDKYYAARFVYNNVGGEDANLYLRADEASNVWDYDSIYNNTSATLYGPSLDVQYANWSNAIRDGSDYLQEGFMTDGTMINSDGGMLTIAVPDENRLVEVFLGSTDAVETPVGGSDYAGVAINGTEGGVTITAVNGTCGAAGSVDAVEVVAAGDLVKVAGAFSGGKSIIVGGFNANTAAKNLQVSEGNTLEDMLISDGYYVAAVLSSGDIVAAGYNASDTGDAASALIDALEALM
jgi:hypothetical protein